MDWRNRKYYLIKNMHYIGAETRLINLKQVAKITLKPRWDITLHPNNKKEKDEHIPRGFYNYVVGCYKEDAERVIDYLEKNELEYMEIKPYKEAPLVKEKEWEEFKNNGLLLFINQILHIFGWAICFEYDKNRKLKSVYPARVRFRGFDNTDVSNAYKNLSKFMKDNADDLYQESCE